VVKKVFGKSKKKKYHSSTSKKAKGIIRYEMLSAFGKNRGYTGRTSRLMHMKANADAYNNARHPSIKLSDYQKGRGLVDAGEFRCYHSDQAEFLSRIYGKKNVDKWSGTKIHNTYAHLIGREYNAMLREKEKKRK
jgi:hypothetical protein